MPNLLFKTVRRSGQPISDKLKLKIQRRFKRAISHIHNSFFFQIQLNALHRYKAFALVWDLRIYQVVGVTIVLDL